MGRHYLLFASRAYSFSILRELQRAMRDAGHEAAWFLYNLSPEKLESDETLLESVDEVIEFNPAAVFVPGNWVPHFFPGIKVQIFHGFYVEKDFFKIRGFFDLYCTHGSVSTARFNGLAEKHGYFAVKETGWAKMDGLFRYKAEESWIKKKDAVGKPVILYAPTFGKSYTSAVILHDEIARLSRTGKYHFLVKLHPLMDKDIADRYRNLQGQGGNLDFIDDDDIIPCLHKADILLSDTSSAVVEFSLLGRPAVTFNANPPLPHVLNIKDAAMLEESLDSLIKSPDSLSEKTEAFKNSVHPYCDGKSGERTLAAAEDFILNHHEKLPGKPLNLFRKYKARKRLGYWK